VSSILVVLIGATSRTFNHATRRGCKSRLHQSQVLACAQELVAVVMLFHAMTSLSYA
jgi:hypothetical protein